MKKVYLGLLFSLLFNVINAQNIEFELVQPDFYESENITQFEDLHNSSIAYADVDNDGDQDVVISGISNTNAKRTLLYYNNGSGFFSQAPDTMFRGLDDGDIAFFDFENDGDQDLIITGTHEYFNNPSVHLYQNDGGGIFTEVFFNSLDPVDNSSVSVADVNNDNYTDVLITGTSNSGRISKLYLNDGGNGFNAIPDSPFDAVKNGDSAFGDVDNDGDQDLIITGYNGFSKITKLYLNDGMANFTESSTFDVEGVWFGEIALFDSDNDDDLDLLITGRNATNHKIGNLYINDGNANYSPHASSCMTIVGVDYSMVTVGDFDGDLDLDIFISGIDSLNFGNSNFYENLGNNYFTQVYDPYYRFYELRSGDAQMIDTDNDNDLDLIVSGFNGDAAITEQFKNEGQYLYRNMSSFPFQAVRTGSSGFADIDGDGDFDLLITGHNGRGEITELYINDGQGNFSNMPHSIKDIYFSSIAFNDIDGDDDQDLLISGFGGSTAHPILYSNNGMGEFSEISGFNCPSINAGSVAFTDVDNDDDSDVLLVGKGSIGFGNNSVLYLNDGDGNFINSLNNIMAVYRSSIAFGDIDNDNDEDLIVTGATNSSAPYNAVTKLYINNGNGVFSEDFNTVFEQLWYSSVVFSDVDNDNDLDIVMSGLNNSDEKLTAMYINDGNGIFSENTNIPFFGLMNGTINAFDVDNDSDMDLLVTGYDGWAVHSDLYKNDGAGNFEKALGLPFQGVYSSAVSVADIDDNLFEDVIISGKNEDGKYITELYRNVSTSIVGITDNKDHNSVSIMPNPAKEIVNIKSTEVSSGQCQILDIAGHVLKQVNIEKGIKEISLDISELPKGLYFVKIGEQVKKLIVE